MRRSLTLLLAALLVTSLVAPAAAASPASASPASLPVDAASGPTSIDATSTDAAGVDATNTSATSDDEVGVWKGIRHNESLDVDQSDGLTDAELEKVVHRAMARVEYVRERPFKEDVQVETMTREEYKQTVSGRESNATHQRWNDQVWKALFMVGENESSAEAIQTVYGGSVTGFYSPSKEKIVLVVAEGEQLQISEATLIHELTHAMQDQYHDLSSSRYVGATQDENLAIDGVVEGEANYIEDRYDQRCGAAWECLPEPESSSGGGGEVHLGILITMLNPYSDGPVYVADLIEEDGWAAVDERMEAPPTSTSQVIHRNDSYATTEIEFEDTATGGWETYPNQGAGGAETVGEASIFTMFWYQSREFGANTFDWRDVLFNTSGPYDTYNYAHESSDGWAGDELYPYRNDEGDAERDGYVWVTEWQTEEDAREFHRTYLTMLEAHDVEHREDGVHEVADGPFRGAYGIERDGTRVTIVHAQEPAEVLELRPGIELQQPTETETSTTTETTEGSSTKPPTATTENSAPGFGVVVAFAALVATALLARRQ
ncbi:Hvo_1808 family surface protein [Haloparvum sp. PAK95]|uniref:Hvo_1808 family surface protein n=1 Tax=Haloparvum sp. PAK95 TaxID=3418962 RepID=UPI003D2EBD22